MAFFFFIGAAVLFFLQGADIVQSPKLWVWGLFLMAIGLCLHHIPQFVYSRIQDK